MIVVDQSPANQVSVIFNMFQYFLELSRLYSKEGDHTSEKQEKGIDTSLKSDKERRR